MELCVSNSTLNAIFFKPKQKVLKIITFRSSLFLLPFASQLFVFVFVLLILTN